MKGHLEKDRDGCKKVQKEDAFEAKSIPKKVQPLSVEFAKITPLEMPDKLLPL